jgi:hydrogenase maturation protein HypF
MAEHGLAGPVIGLALDGTGYGTDGRVWGGEVLIARLDAFERFAHVEYAPMPGGDAAIREPWRMAFGALRAAGLDASAQEILTLMGVRKQEARVIERMIERGVNAPLTSSCGRLFDAAAALILGRRKVDYEAQAAIELEGTAIDEPDRLTRMDYVPQLSGGEPRVLKTEGLWRALIDDLHKGVNRAKIAARFHAGLTEGFIRATAKARDKTGISQVVLSGGCMHNRRLAWQLRSGLEEEGFTVFQHRKVSPGDAGLSYGQAAVAAAMACKSKLAGEPN